MNKQRPLLALACVALAASASAQYYEPVEEELPVTEEMVQSAQVTEIKIVDIEPEEAEVFSIENEEGKIDIKGVQETIHTVVIEPAGAARPAAPVDRIFDMVEQQASFPGGQGALMRWIADNLTYPEEAQENQIEGRVIIRFVINKDGSVSSPVVMRGVDKALDREAIRLVRKMPKWTPGRTNGEIVRSYYVLPIVFKLH